MKEEPSFETDLLHTAYPKADAYGALSMPVYNSAAFEFETAEQMEAVFTGKSLGYTYSRINNPTVQHFEDKVKKITGGISVTALNSGMAAISNVMFTIAQTGSNIVTSRHLFGNTYSFFGNTLAAFGVETRFCDLNKPEQVESLIDKNTCAVFLEIISNPQLEVVDLLMLSEISHRKNVPLIADTTVVPFCAFKANNFGIDIEIVSSTKYISGGGSSIGGLIIDYGNFDWIFSSKLNSIAKEEGRNAFTFKLKKEIHRNLGAYMTPQVAYMQSIGLETMSLRYERATQTCLLLCEKLEMLPEIVNVNYTGLKKNKYYKVSNLQFGEKPGAMFTFDLISREACYCFLNKLKLIKRATNLFDNRTLAIHPASTIFGSFTREIRSDMHVSDTTIRISVGLENLEDLYQDFVQALA